MIASVILSNWPLRLHYLIAKPALESMAADAIAGRKLRVPARAGLFWIKEAEVRDGIVCLWTDLHPWGYTGFVRTDQERFNPWNMVVLSRDWQLMVED